MDKVTQKVYRELDAYLDAHRSEIKSEADLEALIDLFMQQQYSKTRKRRCNTSKQRWNSTLKTSMRCA